MDDNNLQLIENNNENNLRNNPNDKKDEIDFLSFYLNVVPTSIYSLIIGIILLFSETNDNKEYWSQARHIILYLKLMLIIYFLYIIKGFFYFFIMSKNKIKNMILVITIEIFYILLDLSYYLFTIGGKNSFKKLSIDFMMNNLYKTIFIYSLLFIGFTYISLFFLNMIFFITCCIFNLVEFLNNETAFFGDHPGSFRVLLSFLHEEKADLNHTGICPICLEDIELGDYYISLGCSSKHFFHSDCIKKWLDYSSCCPLCKSSDII